MKGFGSSQEFLRISQEIRDTKYNGDVQLKVVLSVKTSTCGLASREGKLVILTAPSNPRNSYASLY